jgi:protein-tyrosine phosphatase
VFSIFSSKRKQPVRSLITDMHSHLLPGIDDGVKNNEESFRVIDKLIELGYEKIITTPHIMVDYYGNTNASVTEAYNNFLPALRDAGYTIPFQYAAEYYFDEVFYSQVTSKEKLLTFGDRHFLFETNFLSEPLQLKEMIFAVTSQGYKPILAHPERYQYMTIEKVEDLRDRGVLLQINLLSLIGFYGPHIQKFAEKIINKGWVDLLGSDCHNPEHAGLLKKVQESKLYHKALELPLLNYSL